MDFPALRAACCALVLLLSGCASRGGPLPRPAPETLAPGSPLLSRTLSESDAWLRHHFMGRTFDDALSLIEGEGAASPGDALLSRLQEGLILHEAGEHRRSNEAFEWAEREADARYTRSLSRAVGSLVVNDRVLAYTPTRGELAMIPYYRMLNYLALGESEGAAVEARKVGLLLSRLERSPQERCGESALMQYLGGLVLASAGERNDALVSLRRSERDFDACREGEMLRAPDLFGADLYAAARSLGVAEVADSAAARYALADTATSTDAGDLVVLVEHGFIAHRSEQALHLPLLPEDVAGLESGQTDGILSAAGTVSARLIDNLAQRTAWGSAWDDDPFIRTGLAVEGAYILRLAWPAYRRDARPPASLRIWVDSVQVGASRVGDLSSVALREFEEERPEMLARLVARGLLKYLVTREAEQKAEKQGGELAAFLVARLGNLAGNSLERADTRSWSLLPDQISMARLRLPAGDHHVRIEALSAAGEVLAARDLGRVRVTAGGLVLRNERMWGGDGGCGASTAGCRGRVAGDAGAGSR